MNVFNGLGKTMVFVNLEALAGGKWDISPSA